MKMPLLLIAIATMMNSPPGAAAVQPSAERDPDRTQTRRAQAVSKSVFDRILEAQEAGQAEDFSTAIALLSTTLANDRLSDYERAIVYQNLGYAYNAAGDVVASIRAFDAVLRIPNLEPYRRSATLYILAQLNTVAERYDPALEHIDAWFDLGSAPGPEALILRAQILYHLERYRDMVEPIEAALAFASARRIEPQENWYALLAFGYFQQENYAGIRDVNKILLEKWPQKRYWLYLGNAFRELGDEANLLAAYDVLYLQGLLRSESELVTLAQLYLQANLPFEAGIVLTGAMDDRLVPRTVSNLKLLSQAWSLAHEYERAIAPLEAAAAMAGDGELYVRLANAYLSLGRHRECADAVRRGLEKGGLRYPDHAQISLGICQYNLKDYVAARRAFRAAAETERSTTTAYRWIRVIDDDLARLRHIEDAEAAVGAQSAARKGTM